MSDEILEAPLEAIPDLTGEYKEKDLFMSYRQFQERFGAEMSMTTYFGAYLKYHPLAQNYIVRIQNGETGYGSRILDCLPSAFWTDQLPKDILEKIRGFVTEDLNAHGIDAAKLDNDFYVENKDRVDAVKYQQTEHYILTQFDLVFRKIYDEKNDLRGLIAQQFSDTVSQNENLRKCLLEGVMISYSQAISEINSQMVREQDQQPVDDSAAAPRKSVGMTQYFSSLLNKISKSKNTVDSPIDPEQERQRSITQYMYLVWNPISKLLAQNSFDTFAQRADELDQFLKKAESKMHKLEKERDKLSFKDSAYPTLNNKCEILKELIQINKRLIDHKIFLDAGYLASQKDKIRNILVEELGMFTKVLEESAKKLTDGIAQMVTKLPESSPKEAQDSAAMDPSLSLMELQLYIQQLIAQNQEMIAAGDPPAIDYIENQERDIKSVLGELRNNEIASHHNPVVRLINAILSLFSDWRIRTPVEEAAKNMDVSISNVLAIHP